MIIIQHGWIIEHAVGNYRKLDHNSKLKAGHEAFNGILRSLEISDKPLKIFVCLFVSLENSIRHFIFNF